MCKWFSCVLTPELGVHHAHWTDRHGDIIEALGLEDKETGRARRFLRCEVEDGDMQHYCIDEDQSDDLPAWYLDNETSYREQITAIVAGAKAYKAVTAPAWAAYEAATATAWAAYEAAIAPARAAYMTLPGVLAMRGAGK